MLGVNLWACIFGPGCSRSTASSGVGLCSRSLTWPGRLDQYHGLLCYSDSQRELFAGAVRHSGAEIHWRYDIRFACDTLPLQIYDYTDE